MEMRFFQSIQFPIAELPLLVKRVSAKKASWRFRFNTTCDYQPPSRFQAPTKPNGSDRSHSRKNRDFNKVKHAAPPLICGDFNTGKTRLNDAIRQFLIRFAEHLHYTYHPKNKLTYPTQFPSRGLDFILVPKPFVVRKANVIKSFASFRLPVVAEIIAPCSTEISVSEPNTQRD